jgi:hypothetical protein
MSSRVTGLILRRRDRIPTIGGECKIVVAVRSVHSSNHTVVCSPQKRTRHRCYALKMPSYFVESKFDKLSQDSLRQPFEA